MKNNPCIISIDNGFGSTKYYALREDKTPIYDSISTIIGQLDSSAESSEDSNQFKFGDNIYYLSDAALRLPASKLIDVQSFEGLKLVTPIFISYFIKKHGIKPDYVALGLSLAQVDRADELIDYCCLQLLMDRSQILLFPQGSSCKPTINSFGTDPTTLVEGSGNTLRTSSYLIVDQGFNSSDFSAVVRGSLSGNTVKGIENTGIIQIARGLIQYIYKSTGRQINISQAKAIIMNKVWKQRGRSVDYTDILKEIVINYYTEFFNILENEFSETLDASDFIFFCGGGAEIIKEYYEDLKPIIQQHFPLDFLVLPDTRAAWYNAIGYYLAAQKIIANNNN